MENVIKIYADGACRGNQFSENIGAYGIVLLYNNNKKYLKEAFINTTNNRMEILSIIKGLEALKKFDIPVEIYSDSAYVVNTLNEGWRRNANLDLWETLDQLLSKFKTVKLFKVKGHADNEYNNLADKLANEAMDALQQGG